MSLPMVGDWNDVIFKILSNSSHGMILYWVKFSKKHQDAQGARAHGQAEKAGCSSGEEMAQEVSSCSL